MATALLVLGAREGVSDDAVGGKGYVLGEIERKEKALTFQTAVWSMH